MADARKRRKIFLLSALAAIVVVAVVGIAIWNKPHRSASNEEGIRMTAAQLQEAYAKSEATANATYLDKTVELSGTVAAVEKNQDGKQVLYLEDPMMGVGCTLRDSDATPVQVGQTIRVKGFCSGSAGIGVAVRECVIVK